MADVKREKEQDNIDGANQSQSPDNRVYDILVEKKKPASIDTANEPKQELSMGEKEPVRLANKIELVPTTKPEKEKEEVKKEELTATQSVAASFYHKQVKAIDSILAEGLHEVFLKMDAKKQQEFKAAGEETALKISTLLQQAKVKVDKIIALIKKWLQIIPGVNQFFLEQEAKIKADKIIRLKDKF
jgi:hypothetical protein